MSPKAPKKPAPKTSVRRPVRPAAAKTAPAKAGTAKAGPGRPLSGKSAKAGPKTAAILPPKKKLKSPIGKADLEKFRQHLRALLDNRRSDKESREREALKSTGQDFSVDHMADQGSDNYEQEFTLGLLENDVETLRDINDALARIEEGSFGLCEECEAPIARARLKALPYARMCVECKMKEE